MDGVEARNDVEDTLMEHSFLYTGRCDVRPKSFDYAARREDFSLLLKVSVDIDSVVSGAASEMKTASRVLRALSLIVGERAGRKRLTRGTAYFRYGVPALSIETFRDLLGGQPPLAYAAPGGEFVDVDGGRLREKRMEAGLSRGDLSSATGVTRSTIRRYESGEGNPSVNVLLRIDETLDVPLVRPVKLQPKEGGDRDRAPQLKPLESRILELLEEIGLSVIPTRRTPFNAVSRDDEEVVLMGVAERGGDISRRASMISEISEVLGSRSVFILKSVGDVGSSDVPLVGLDELGELDEGGGFFDLLEERCV